jgi:hypothetical protein
MHMPHAHAHAHAHVHVTCACACACINAPEGCRHGTHTNGTAYIRGTYTHKHTQTHTNTHKHTQTHSAPRTNTHKRTQTHASTNKHTARPDKVRWASHRAPSRLAPPRPQTGKKYNYLQLKAMFRLADLDNSGSIDFNEFLHAQRRVKKESDP